MVDAKLIEHLCNLSKLSLTEEELECFTSDMEAIMKIMDSINDVEITGDIDREKGVYFKDLREDVAEESYQTDAMLSNAKQRQEDAFAVPKLF